MIDAAAANGGKADPGSKQDRNGMVYGRSFQDPAGHHLGAHADGPSAAEQGASAMENA